MNINLKKTLIFLIILAVIIFTGLKITKLLLYHKYETRKFGLSGKEKGVVIIFHGIYGESKDLQSIDNFITSEGYAGINIQYPTTEGTIEEITEKYISEHISYYIKYVEEENTKRRNRKLPEIKINFIVHSLGSVVLRHYLKNHKLEDMGKVIFISPPSHGSHLADFPLTSLLKGTLGEAASQFSTVEDSFVNMLGEPNYSCYVMIGDKSNNFLYSWIIPGIDDGMVPFSTARLNNCKYKTIRNSTHTSILTDKRTLEEIRLFLEN